MPQPCRCRHAWPSWYQTLQERLSTVASVGRDIHSIPVECTKEIQGHCKPLVFGYHMLRSRKVVELGKNLKSGRGLKHEVDVCLMRVRVTHSRSDWWLVVLCGTMYIRGRGRTDRELIHGGWHRPLPDDLNPTKPRRELSSAPVPTSTWKLPTPRFECCDDLRLEPFLPLPHALNPAKKAPGQDLTSTCSRGRETTLPGARHHEQLQHGPPGPLDYRGTPETYVLRTPPTCDPSPTNTRASHHRHPEAAHQGRRMSPPSTPPRSPMSAMTR